MDPIIIFRTARLTTSIAAYFKLIENVNENVSKMVHEPFKSASINLTSAFNANSENAIMYLKQALIEFTRSCSLEINENLISAYVGKAMCQHLLRDYVNRDITLSRIKDVELTLSEKAKAGAKDFAKYLGLGWPYYYYKLYKRKSKGESFTMSYDERVSRFNEYKQKALAIQCDDLSEDGAPLLPQH